MKTKNVLTSIMLLSFVTVLTLASWAVENEKELNKVNETTVEIQLIIPDNDPSGYLASDPGIDNITNYPEPFVSSTTIEYNLERSGYVSLIIHYQGNKIEVFARDYQRQGSHIVEFDASNLPPGIYTCVLALDGELRYETMVKKTPFSHKKYLEN